MMLAYQPVRSLSVINMGVNQGISAASRILPLIDNKNLINEVENPKNLEIHNAEVELKDVSFAYENNEGDVLKSINLNFAGGKMTSLVGHSGSGKTTILNLIPRFYDPHIGDILIDNQ